MRKHTIIMVFLILSSINLAYAEFTASTGKDIIEICSCSSYSNDFLLINSGSSTSTYSISQSGDAKEWSTIFPDSATILAGEREIIYSNIKIPCKAKGSYALDTTFVDSSGIQKRIRQTIVVEHCNSASVEIDSNLIEMCPCKTKTAIINIRNNGDSAETYDFSLDEEPEILLKISSASITLNPGQESEIYLFFDSECSYSGKSEIILNVKSRKAGKSEDLTFYVDIKPCYDYGIIFGENMNRDVKLKDIKSKEEYYICEGQTTRIPFAITNYADIKNDYIFNIKAPDYARLMTSEVLGLSRNKSSIGYIELSPKQHYVSYDTIKLTSEIKIGVNTEEHKIPVHVVRCITPEFSAKAYRYTGYYEDYMPFTIKNTGYNDALYSISLDGPKWIRIIDKERYEEPKEISLSSEESKDFLIVIDAGQDIIPGNYKAYISLYSEDQDSPYIKEIELRLRKESLGTKAYSFILTNWWKIIIALIVFLILIRYIKGIAEDRRNRPQRLEPLSKKELSEEKDYGFIWAIIIILIVIAAFFIAWRFLPDTQSSANETIQEPVHETDFQYEDCTFIWNNDKDLRINLSESFSDPDGDELFFDYDLSPLYATVRFEGDIAVIRAEEDFVGLDHIQFTADDGKGGFIKSGLITLCFEEGDGKMQWGMLSGWFRQYMFYILAGIIILAVIIVIMNMSEKPMPEEDLPEDKTKKRKKKSRK